MAKSVKRNSGKKGKKSGTKRNNKGGGWRNPFQQTQEQMDAKTVEEMFTAYKDNRDLGQFEKKWDDFMRMREEKYDKYNRLKIKEELFDAITPLKESLEDSSDGIFLGMMKTATAPDRAGGKRRTRRRKGKKSRKTRRR